MMRITLLLLLLCLAPAHARAGDVASFYGYESGFQTANGERFDPLGLTCAHRTLPFNTMLRVTYRGKSTACRVNDRGPFIAGRTVDLSLGAAIAIGLERIGVAPVTIDRMF